MGEMSVLDEKKLAGFEDSAMGWFTPLERGGDDEEQRSYFKQRVRWELGLVTVMTQHDPRDRQVRAALDRQVQSALCKLGLR